MAVVALFSVSHENGQKMEKSNNYFSSYRVNKNLTLDGLNVCMNYKFNLLHHVGVVAKSQ